MVDEAEIFEGGANKISLIQTDSKRFHCTYLLHNFPFDTQVKQFISNSWEKKCNNMVDYNYTI